MSSLSENVTVFHKYTLYFQFSIKKLCISFSIAFYHSDQRFQTDKVGEGSQEELGSVLQAECSQLLQGSSLDDQRVQDSVSGAQFPSWSVGQLSAHGDG